ncbi:ATP-dependent (S)-NAD(P)H-hydrate dehydratase [Trinorchestia longiramus]|nr:ATP-dependent (S)-NAD(P)H-hydrate dehydratase [Trinorchestia longiramus]
MYHFALCRSAYASSKLLKPSITRYKFGTTMNNMESSHSNAYTNKQLITAVSAVIPPLLPSAHKGQAGRIGIVGGSLEYTGAPYFAGISALRSGADLCHVFCSSEAAGPIKGYSPELIVHPVLDSSDPMAEISQWLPRLHSLVLGPGLGRRPQIFATLNYIIQDAIDKQIPMVFDADALFYLNDNFDVLKGYKNIILTPNRVELARLYRSVMKRDLRADDIEVENIEQLSKRLGVTILSKGQTDIIVGDDVVLKCDIPGAPRRCGGQGDVLSGTAALFYYWAHGTAVACHNTQLPLPPAPLAAWAAAALTRTAMNIAFRSSGRSTLTSDVLNTVPQAFSSLFSSK